MHADHQVILGYCITPRYLGAAIAIDRRAALLPALRIRDRGETETEGRRIRERIARDVSWHRPGIVVLDGASLASDHPVVARVRAALDAAVMARGARIDGVARDRIAQTLGIDGTSFAAIRRALIERDPSLAHELVRAAVGRRPRTERERYWEPAMVAAAAALAASQPLAPMSP